jgi:predicted tellurium resistance membrane protein TerC
MLALSFLILIGLTLIGEGLDFHTPKGYIYFAMAFSFGVEMLNIRVKRQRQDHLRLRKTQLADLVDDKSD